MTKIYTAMTNQNVTEWFEIPVKNMERAVRFYEEVFSFKLSRNKFDTIDMAWFPWTEKGTGSGGSLVYNEDWYKPSAEGVLIYFTSPSGDLANELSKVEKAGGKVIRQKTLISKEHGFMGLFIDSEGNRVAMYSRE